MRDRGRPKASGIWGEGPKEGEGASRWDGVPRKTLTPQVESVFAGKLLH